MLTYNEQSVTILGKSCFSDRPIYGSNFPSLIIYDARVFFPGAAGIYGFGGSSLTLLGGIEGSDQHSADRTAIVKNTFCYFSRNNICLLYNHDPIFCFITFLKGYLQFCDEIRFTMSIFRFPYIGANACTTSFKLIRQRIMHLYSDCQIQK